MDNYRFSYAHGNHLREDPVFSASGLPWSEGTEALFEPLKIGEKHVANRVVFHPMEGSDGGTDGTPGALTLRRYQRFAESGAGLIWFEATAVCPEGRASDQQLWLHEGNLEAFRSMLEDVRERAVRTHGVMPVCVLQLTHSGRFSRKGRTPAPRIAQQLPELGPRLHPEPGEAVMTDAELEQLVSYYETTALLAESAGFDGVDVKACHRYLLSELLSARERPGPFGGGFEGRTRLLLSICRRLREVLRPETLVSVRLNIADGIPLPWGWGSDETGSPDLREPLTLAGALRDAGVRLLNVTMGTPYHNPHVNRPYDQPGEKKTEPPVEGTVRLLMGAAQIQRTYPEMAVVGTGFSWLRELGGNVAAAMVRDGMLTMAGFGRQAFAYPTFVQDMQKGGMDRKKACITCARCSDILRAGGPSGCVIRDAEVYGDIYRIWVRQEEKA